MPPEPKEIQGRKTVLYIWRSRVVYFGLLGLVKNHRYASSAILTGIDSSFKIRSSENEQWKDVRNTFVLADSNLEMDLEENVLGLFLFEPELDLALKNKYPVTKQNYQNIMQQDDSWLALSKRLYEEVPEADEAKILIDQQLARLGIHYPDEDHLDPRVKIILEVLRQDDGHHFDASKLAAMVNLSASRLGHLFREQTGITLARFRTLYRMRAFTNAIEQGNNLTEGAMAAGFTDSSHLNRSFKDMFGIAPSKVFAHSDELVIRIGKN